MTCLLVRRFDLCLVGVGLCRTRFARGGLVRRSEGISCSDACSDQACAFLATAAGALLVLRCVTRACSFFSCCILALHRREAPLRSAGSPAHGPAPHAANNRIAGKWSAFKCSHIPKIGRNAPVTLRYSDHDCRRSILNLGLWDCFFPVLRTLTWRSTEQQTACLRSAPPVSTENFVAVPGLWSCFAAPSSSVLSGMRVGVRDTSTFFVQVDVSKAKGDGSWRA